MIHLNESTACNAEVIRKLKSGGAEFRIAAIRPQKCDHTHQLREQICHQIDDLAHVFVLTF
jgi:hypothetical protein